MEIMDGSQLKAAYGILNDMQGMKALPGREEAVQKHIKQLKRDIRAFLRQQEAKAERRIIREYGINGYVELVKLPGTLHTVEEAADRWADGIGREGEAAWAELKLQADAYRQHRRQRKVCNNLLQVLEKYGEEEEKGGEGQEEGSGTVHVSL